MEFDLFEKGGFVMYILAGLSVYTIAIILFKIYQFVTAGVFDNRYVEPVVAAVRVGDLPRAKEILLRAKGPVARIMQVALDCVSNREMLPGSRDAEVSRVGSTDIRYLESHMRGLEMVSNVSPLLGLLGTVIGMVTAFARLEGAGARVDPSLLAGGIWEALLTTVAGLVVAIPAVAAYYIFDGIIERVRGTMKDVSTQIMLLEDRFQRDEREMERRREQARLREQEERDRLQAAGYVANQASATASESRKAEEQHRKAEEEARQREAAAAEMRSTAQSSSTLKLLNPRYSQF